MRIASGILCALLMVALPFTVAAEPPDLFEDLELEIPYLPWPRAPTDRTARVYTDYGDVSGIGPDGELTSAHGIRPIRFREPLVELAHFGRTSCKLFASGRLTCWTGHGVGPFEITGRFVSIAAGFEFACGVRVDGRIICWGSSGDMPGQPPSGLFRQIDASPTFVCALRDGLHDDGPGVECWGGMSGVSSQLSRDGDFIAVSAHEGRVCALRSDGDAQCWSIEYGDEPIRPGPYERLATTTSCLGTNRDHYTCGVLVDGQLDCWSGGRGYALTPPPSGTYKDVDVAFETACAVHLGNTVVCWRHSPTVPLTEWFPRHDPYDRARTFLPPCIAPRRPPVRL